jgi:hypothetical protein
MCVIVYFQLILGETLGKIWLIVAVGSMITQTTALYGFLSNLLSKREDAVRTIVLYIGASFGLLNVYRWCSEAQKVEECVSMICVFINNMLWKHLGEQISPSYKWTMLQHFIHGSTVAIESSLLQLATWCRWWWNYSVTWYARGWGRSLNF